ncbi:PspA/IM30 family protein [Nocardia huaxiensis]|uniref:PspA/IM30 family protein n=1 Tax=Nocardia huaxiensis TaxID=2755382 RepID=UPI001E438FAB|nr:hypothetical protein [Nocardia huaxiensis]UFS99251.1 hypothetical protein LPY97_15825 [Nocardia huaxiensis]
MNDSTGLAGELAKLPDAELAAVVEAATDGRAGLAALHAVAASVAATVGHAPIAVNVSTDTPIDAELVPHETPGTFEQVGATPGVSGIPVPPTGMPSGTVGGGYTTSGVPTFESVRDKVEQRYGTAQGMGDLDRQTPAGRSAEEQWDARAKAARERLEQIRKSVHGNDNG